MLRTQSDQLEQEICQIMAKYGIPAATFLSFHTEADMPYCLSFKLNAAGDNNPSHEPICKMLSRVAFDGAVAAIASVPSARVLHAETDFGNGVRQSSPDKN